MKDVTKAGVSAKVKKNGIIKLTIIATVAVIGIIFSVYSAFNMQYLFALLYFIAACLGVIYSIMKINTVLPPSIECDGKILSLTTWDNCIFPYDVNFKPSVFADFVPAKTKSFELTVSEISSVVIGSKGFIVRTSADSDIEHRFFEILGNNKKFHNIAKRSDIFYVKLKDGSVYFMSVDGFDANELYDIIDTIAHYVHGLEFKTNIRILRKKWEAGTLMRS